MSFHDFAEAILFQMNAFLIVNNALTKKIRPELAQLFIPDPLTRCVGERFGSPAVKWIHTENTMVVKLNEGTAHIERQKSGGIVLSCGNDSVCVELIDGRYKFL